MSLQTFWLLVGFGVVTGSLVAVAAIGFTLMATIGGAVNFAYGEYMTLAAYFAFTLSVSGGLPLALGILLAILALAAFGVFGDRLVLRPLVGRGELTILVTTIGLALVMQNVIRAIWGTDIKRIDLPSGWSSVTDIGPFQFSALQLVIVGLSIAILVALAAFLRSTNTGRAMRGMSDDQGLAQLSGVPVARMRAITWALASALAAVSGLLLVLSTQLTPTTGLAQLLIIASAVVVGGFGSLVGAVAAAYLLGVLMEVSTGLIDPSLKPTVAFGALVLVLLLRPEGLFRRAVAT